MSAVIAGNPLAKHKLRHIPITVRGYGTEGHKGERFGDYLWLGNVLQSAP